MGMRAHIAGEGATTEKELGSQEDCVNTTKDVTAVSGFSSRLPMLEGVSPQQDSLGLSHMKPCGLH